MTDRGGKVAGGEVSGGAAEPFRDILVVDLLGGIGDLIMALPMVHCLARRNSGATLRVLTHEPAADLVRGDPAVAEVHVPRYGRPNAERVAVADALAARRPDLAVTTTRFDGIPGLLAACGARCVTDLWRRPPPEEPVGKRYLRILADEGLLDAADVHAVPRVSLRTDELAAGAALLAERLRAAGAHHPRALANKDCGPVVFVPESGMAVKQWPASRWRQLSARVRADGHAVLAVSTVSGLEVATLPRVSLRQLAAVFAAVAVRDGVVVGGDTGPMRLAAAAGARTVSLFGPTLASRYGLGSGADLQGLPACPHRRPTSITEQICWWDAQCPLSHSGPACMDDIGTDAVVAAVRQVTR